MSLTKVLSLTAKDTLVYPDVQWLDETNNPIAIDSTNYDSLFNMFLETTLAAPIQPKQYKDGVHWLDSSTYTLISATDDKVYVDDNIYPYIKAGTVLMIDYELMKVVGVEKWDSDKNQLQINVLRGWTELTEIVYDSTTWHDTTALALASNQTRNWQGIIWEKFHQDSTAWDSTTWYDTTALAAKGVPLQLGEVSYTPPYYSSDSPHQKGETVRVFIYKDSTAYIDEIVCKTYFKWPIKPPLAPPGRYMATFTLRNKNTGELVMLPNSADKCGNERILILNVWRY
jgi:hypothetical protein